MFTYRTAHLVDGARLEHFLILLFSLCHSVFCLPRCASILLYLHHHLILPITDHMLVSILQVERRTLRLSNPSCNMLHTHNIHRRPCIKRPLQTTRSRLVLRANGVRALKTPLTNVTSNAQGCNTTRPRRGPIVARWAVLRRPCSNLWRSLGCPCTLSNLRRCRHRCLLKCPRRCSLEHTRKCQ